MQTTARFTREMELVRKKRFGEKMSYEIGLLTEGGQQLSRYRVVWQVV